MSNEDSPLFRDIDEQLALRTILEGTVTTTGESFFTELVKHLVGALGTDGAWVTELVPDRYRLKALAFLMDGEWIHNYEFQIAGTPCETVIESSRLIHFPGRLVELYPHDQGLRESGCVSYLGVPLLDVDGKCLGHWLSSIAGRCPTNLVQLLSSKSLPPAPQRNYNA